MTISEWIGLVLLAFLAWSCKIIWERLVGGSHAVKYGLPAHPKDDSDHYGGAKFEVARIPYLSLHVGSGDSMDRELSGVLNNDNR